MATTMISGNAAAMTANAFWTLIKPQKRNVRAYLGELIRQSFAEDDAEEHISKAEVLDGICAGLLDVKADMRSGIRQKTLQEVIDEF